jgi:ADP-ribose pyrophosphatase YjhB (NUDIX family)
MNAPLDRRLPAKRAKAAMASLELATAMARVTVAKGIEPKPLYVRRDLLNGGDLVAWAKRVGIPAPIAASEMHVTICYSRKPVDWLAMQRDYRDAVEIGKGGPRVLARFGKMEKKVAVLAFASSDLEWRHREMVDQGASFDFDHYRPHVTISYDIGPDFDLESVEPYQGVLRFGPEIFEPIDDDFEAKLAKGGWWSQPRIGQGPKGGQWKAMGGSGSGGWASGKEGPSAPPAAPAGPVLTTPWLGQNDVAAHRYKADPQQAAFMKPMKESEMTGQPAWLGNDEGIVLKNPQKPSDVASNANPDDRATFVAGHDPGEGLNGVPFKPWDGPEGGDWTKVDGTGSFDEPDLPATKGKRLGAGVVITEDDGRVWTLTPTNNFGGYFETLPKGGIEPGLNLRQTAIKEAWEESGLKVELTGYIGDFERNTSVARYYTAKRVGGDPTDFHWETAASHLVPMADLDDALHHINDKPILARLKGESDQIIKLALGFADLVEILGDVIEKAKAWSTQPRVPSGFSTGGRWSKGGYGSGGWGMIHAEEGTFLTLQKHGGTGPQSEALNAKIKLMEDAANQGYLHPSAQKLILKPKPTQTYSAAAWESANEAATYVNVMKGQGKKFYGGPAPDGGQQPPKAKAGVGPLKNVDYLQPIGTFKDPMDIATLTKVGAKPGGTAAGGLYKDAAGDQWVVKSYNSEKMAFNEVAASKLYEQMGVSVPEMKLIELGGEYKGGIGVASKMMTLNKFDEKNPAHIKAAQEDFAAHALMANWDAVGQGFDNLMIDPKTGKAVLVDPGGSMLYRAQGEPKGAKFKDNVAELDTMRDPLTNPQAAAVFGKMTQEQIVASMQKAIAGLGDSSGAGILGLKQETASAIVNHWGGSNKVPDTMGLIDKMDNRLTDLQSKAVAMSADFQTTSTMDVTQTGTTKTPIAHSDPMVERMANLQSTQVLSDLTDAKIKENINLEAGLTGSSASFYTDTLDKVSVKAFNGDTAGVALSFYAPTTKTAKLSANYGIYKKAFANLQVIANAQAAIAAKKTAGQGDGGMVTGAAKVSPADVTQKLKATGMAAPDTNMLHPDWAADPTNLGAQIEAANNAQGFKPNLADDLIDIDTIDFDALDPVPGPDAMAAMIVAGVDPTSSASSFTLSPVPKPDAVTTLKVPTAMPAQPKLSSPANPNVKLNAIANEIAKLATSGDPDAAAKVQALSATIKGSNSFSVKAKTYAANVVSALGGQAVIDAMPAAPKKAAMEAAIKVSVKAQAAAPLKSSTAIIGGYQVVTETTVKPFDPSTLQTPPDFANWHGPGKPLYNSQPQFNQINTQAAQSLYALAVAQDKAGLLQKDVSQSNQLKSYKAVLQQSLDTIGIKQEKRSLLDATGKPADPKAAVTSIIEGFKVPKQGVAKDKFEAHVVVGKVDPKIAQALYDTIPQTVIAKNSTQLAKFKQMTSIVMKDPTKKAIVQKYTGSGYQSSNPALRNPKSSQHETYKEQAKQIWEASYELPPGLVMSRTFDHGDFAGWKAQEGSIITEPGIISTSLRGSKPNETPVFAKNESWMRIIAGPGLKGMDVASNDASSMGLTEAEILLPRNTRFMISRVYKGKDKPPSDDPFFSQVPPGKTIIEVIAYNPDHMD